MGFRKVRLFEITTEIGQDGYPVYGATPIRLQGTGTRRTLTVLVLNSPRSRKRKHSLQMTKNE